MVDKDVVEASILSDKFISLISVCNKQHLQFCRCQEDKINTLTNKYMVSEIRDMKKKNLLDNESVFDMRYKHAKNMAIIDIANECEKGNIRCPIEQAEIKQTVKLFGDRFDLEDPRVYMIVKAILSHQLSVYRMQLQSNYRGILQSVTSETGDTTYVLNPVEESKRKLDDSIINAIEKLSKIIDGESVNVNMVMADTIKQVWEDRKKKIIEMKKC